MVLIARAMSWGYWDYYLNSDGRTDSAPTACDPCPSNPAQPAISGNPLQAFGSYCPHRRSPLFPLYLPASGSWVQGAMRGPSRKHEWR